jgi:hypothetical protein
VIVSKIVSKITMEEHNSLPTYLKSQLTLELLNSTVVKLGTYSASKTNIDGRFCITEVELKTELDTGI